MVVRLRHTVKRARKFKQSIIYNNNSLTIEECKIFNNKNMTRQVRNIKILMILNYMYGTSVFFYHFV